MVYISLIMTTGHANSTTSVIVNSSHMSQEDGSLSVLTQKTHFYRQGKRYRMAKMWTKRGLCSKHVYYLCADMYGGRLYLLFFLCSLCKASSLRERQQLCHSFVHTLQTNLFGPLPQLLLPQVLRVAAPLEDRDGKTTLSHRKLSQGIIIMDWSVTGCPTGWDPMKISSSSSRERTWSLSGPDTGTERGCWGGDEQGLDDELSGRTLARRSSASFSSSS